MRPVATLSLYAAALAVVFGAAVGVGNAVGPVGTAGTDSAAAMEGMADTPSAEHGGVGDEKAAELPGGLATSQDGYTLRLSESVRAAGTSASDFRFVIEDPEGEPLTDYTRSHDKDLHLIVARRDLTGFQHLHPTRADDGTWSVPLALPDAGPYKVFADFTPAGSDRARILAADLTVPGTYAPRPVPPAAASAEVDGYDVELDGQLVAGTSSRVELTISKDGQPVTDLEPYLGAYGHLVALRDGDLAYLHVHPEQTTGSGPTVTFFAEVPSAATYRLFLDFQHGGVVRTAELTAVATPGRSTKAPTHEQH